MLLELVGGGEKGKGIMVGEYLYLNRFDHVNGLGL